MAYKAYIVGVKRNTESGTYKVLNVELGVHPTKEIAAKIAEKASELYNEYLTSYNWQLGYESNPVVHEVQLIREIE